MSQLTVSFDWARVRDSLLALDSDRSIEDRVREFDFRSIMDQLRRTGSLNHIPLTFKTIAQNPLTYNILIRGNPPSTESDEQGHHPFFTFWKDGELHWIAGICCLHFPNPDDLTTAQVAVSLLPEARKQGVGKEAIRMITKFAFDILRVRRIVAPIMCPILPDYTPAEKKRVIFETKRLCWIFERYGFKFEGVSRGEVNDLQETSVWHDIHRMSMLVAEFLAGQMENLFSHLPSTKAAESSSPWESMTRRHDEEQKQMELWNENPTPTVKGDDCYDDDGGSDECEDPEDFDD